MPPDDENNEILSSCYNKFSQLTLTSNDVYHHLFLKIAVALKNADNCSMTKKKKERKTQKRVVSPTSLETLPFVYWLISSLNCVRFSTASV